MKPGLPIIWRGRHRLHESGGVGIGARTPGTEPPRRAETIRDALRARDALFGDARARHDVGAVDPTAGAERHRHGAARPPQLDDGGFRGSGRVVRGTAFAALVPRTTTATR